MTWRAPEMSKPGRQRQPMSLNHVARALLGAIAFLFFVPATFGVVGGLFPNLPPFGPFGLVLNTGFPWIFISLVASLLLGGVVVALGGRRARWMLAANVVVLVGAGYIGYRYVAFAADHGATYDVVRALDGFPPIRYADKTVTFASVDGTDLEAELWFPDGADAATEGSLPAVIFVHGGAFQGGFPGTRPLLMEAIDRAGFVAIDVDYRLAPPPRWDQAPGDVMCAMAWVRTAPELWMVDPARVVLVGESAGGSLAIVAGYAAGTDVVASSCPGAGAAVVPAGIFLIAPTVDLAGLWDDATLLDTDGGRFPEAYIGGTPAQYPERYAAAEPFRLLRPGLPPVVILGGDIDRLIHVNRLTSVGERIRAAGSEAEVFIAPLSGHGWDGEPNSFGNQLVETLVPNFVRKVAG